MLTKSEYLDLLTTRGESTLGKAIFIVMYDYVEKLKGLSEKNVKDEDELYRLMGQLDAYYDISKNIARSERRQLSSFYQDLYEEGIFITFGVSDIKERYEEFLRTNSSPDYNNLSLFSKILKVCPSIEL